MANGYRSTPNGTNSPPKASYVPNLPPPTGPVSSSDAQDGMTGGTRVEPPKASEVIVKPITNGMDPKTAVAQAQPVPVSTAVVGP
jgi:hypothetical protein